MANMDKLILEVRKVANDLLWMAQHGEEDYDKMKLLAERLLAALESGE